MLRRESVFRFSWVVEAGAVGWFLVQALRLLPGALYSHISSADIVLRLGDPGPTVTGVVLPATAQAEVTAVGVALFVPLLAFLLARRAFAFPLTAAVVAVGRVFMTLDAPFVKVLGAAVTVAGAMLYLAATARQQPARAAVVLTLGFSLDQIVRALGQTFDPTWTEGFLGVQTALSLLLFLVAVLRAGRSGAVKPSYAGITPGGGIALGALLFLECALLALPNAAARWSGIDYAVVAPALVVATALPLIPEVRDAARRFLTLFDPQWRGWLWLLTLGLLLVIGSRFDGAGAAAALALAQLMAVLSFWWVVSPAEGSRRDLTGPALVLGLMVFVVLVGADFFTYEYAFVRDFGQGLAWLAALLRAMRGLGLAVMLVAAALAAIPLMDPQRRVPWQRGQPHEAWFGLLAAVTSAIVVILATLPPDVMLTTNADRVRVATYNIHGGYSLYFDYSLPAMATTISVSGADVAMLQEVEAGRLTSYGVDQALWLGRRLNMQVRYLPTNEALQGLAVLSRVPITLDGGALLTSRGMQTGVQRVQVRPDEGVLDVYNTWLGLLFNPAQLELQEQDQWQQLEETLALIAADHPGGVVGRLVLGGTFNNTPASPLYDLLVRTGFSDPFDGMSPERSATLYRGGGTVARFDYLWLRNVLPTGRAVLEQDASDHRLAVVELNLAP